MSEEVERGMREGKIRAIIVFETEFVSNRILVDHKLGRNLQFYRT